MRTHCARLTEAINAFWSVFKRDMRSTPWRTIFFMLDSEAIGLAVKKNEGSTRVLYDISNVAFVNCRQGYKPGELNVVKPEYVLWRSELDPVDYTTSYQAFYD